MKNVVLAAATLLAAGSQAMAESAFTWEGELELGVDAVVDSDAAGNEISDVYGVLEVAGELKIGDGASVFAVLLGETVEDPTDDRILEDMGFFLQELGVSFDIGSNASVAIGKSAPVFGRTWDDAAGFYSDILAGDYEQTEQIGVFADVELVPGGTLSFGVYYADDTFLSRSVGTDRGRNQSSAGGAGNTGKLDNFALAWTQEFGDTSVQVGMRHLSASVGDVDDETGFVASVAHGFTDDFAVFAEVATFDSFGGSADDATFFTLTGVYHWDDWAFSGLYAHRDLDAGGETDAVSLSAEYEFESGIVFGTAVAFVDDNGTEDTRFGANVIIPFGG